MSRLARHYRGAGADAEPGRTLAVLLAAGERAWAIYTNEEAAQHYAAALGMVREGHQVADLGDCSLNDEQLLPWLLERLGEVWARIGEGAAISVWNEALLVRERAGDAVAVARLRCRLALAELDRGRLDRALAHVTAGLAALANCQPCQEQADLQVARFHILNRLGEAVGAAETLETLLLVTKELASPRAEAEAKLAMSSFCWWRNDIAQAREYALQALEVSERAEEMAISCQAYIVLAATGLHSGEHRFMRGQAESGLAVAQRLGAPDAEITFRFYLAFANFMAGSWAKSLRLNGEAVALARRIGHARGQAYLLAQRAMILALQGDLSEAEACLAEVGADLGSPSREGSADKYVVSLAGVAETALTLERGQPELAASIARALVRPLAAGAAPAGLKQLFTPMGLMLLAEVQVAAGEPESALETAGKLMALNRTDVPYLAALASRAEGIAWRGLSQREAALACLERAHREFAALEMPFEAARCLLEMAEVGDRGSGVRDQGSGGCEYRPGIGGGGTGPRSLTPVQAALHALAIFESLGIQRYVDRARRLLRELGVSPPTRRRTQRGKEALSLRQLEIARLIAEGMTTNEITVRLCVSRRTVENHLEHIYRRLGVGSRAALTRYVCEAGLLSPAHKR
ncbi:MAG: response regulator transcription factor [Chloroflexi bacterium]|nr:response regulator transcription factor [Chloroflexota bacterium]